MEKQMHHVNVSRHCILEAKYCGAMPNEDSQSSEGSETSHGLHGLQEYHRRRRLRQTCLPNVRPE